SIRFRVKEATLEAVDDQMTLIHIQNCGSGWRAGQHVHVRLISPGGISNESHSFSIVNAPPTSKGSPISVPSTRALFPNATTPTSATPLVRRIDSDEDDLRARSVLTLAARVTGTWTSNLNSIARAGLHTSGPIDTSPAPSTSSTPVISPARIDAKAPMRVLVDGPYGAPPLPSGERIVMVCGGSGAAYIVGVLADWLGGDDTSSKDEDEDGHSPIRAGVRSVLLVWYVREARCVRWFAHALRHIGELARARGVKVVLRICVTRERGRLLVSESGTESPSGAAKDFRLSTLSDLDARQTSYLVASESENGLLGLGLPGSIEFARPCIGDIVHQQVESWAAPDLDVESDGGTSDAYERVPGGDAEMDEDTASLSTATAASLLAVTEERRGTGVFVVCCGPMPMVTETKVAVARLPVQAIRRAGGVWLHTEAYEL
ncbi:hypothetical protein FRC07_000115, partial [Ceratobasidium sp. 392]